jgi:hypothetical protein
MNSNDARAIERDLANWSEPLIADRALESYTHFTDDAEIAKKLCGAHCRMWRNLIMDSSRLALTNRRELLRLGRLIGMSPGAVDAIDRAIIDELMSCVFARFHNCRAAAMDQTRALLLAASGLVEVRLAA